MNEREYPIPTILNIFIAAAQLTGLLAMFWAAGWVSTWPGVIVVALLYGILMNSAYSTIHEAEHNLFHTNSRLNDAVGVILALFFPAPFHLIRQGHLGHHLRNRSDDEAFDVYFEEDKPKPVEQIIERVIERRGGGFPAVLGGIIAALLGFVVGNSSVLSSYLPSSLRGPDVSSTVASLETQAGQQADEIGTLRRAWMRSGSPISHLCRMPSRSR